jgi:hypothetical protein
MQQASEQKDSTGHTDDSFLLLVSLPLPSSESASWPSDKRASVGKEGRGPCVAAGDTAAVQVRPVLHR